MRAPDLRTCVRRAERRSIEEPPHGGAEGINWGKIFFRCPLHLRKQDITIFGDMAGKKLTVKELKAVRARKREERLANMDRAMQLRAGGASLTEIAEQMHVALTTVASWVALRQAVERIDSERARKAS